MSNNEYWRSNFGLTGQHATFHNQCFQMFKLTMTHCNCKRNGLNPHALLHEAETSNNELAVKQKRNGLKCGVPLMTKHVWAIMQKRMATTKKEATKTDMTNGMTMIQTTKKRKSVMEMGKTTM